MTLKKKDYENLSSENIKKVISLLDSDKPITKKDACEMLNIAYNTKRLASVIADHHERIAYTEKRKSQNKGKPASTQEIQEAVTEYLQGSSYTEIAKSLFRSTPFIKNMLEKIGVPQRGLNQEEKYSTSLIPEECRAEEFQPGEIVWSAKYHAMATIRSELNTDYITKNKGLSAFNYASKYLGNCYAIYVQEKVDSSESFFPGVQTGGFNAYAPAYDLGKLEHLKEYGITLW